ncbi:MAG: FAD-dependent oxidoreductase [Planctomycetaceae bacterium]|nr:FAD-dependent oxidoreductase [Planctomycetaceae bacterium]
MNHPTGRHRLNAVLAIASLIGSLPLSGCSQPATPKVSTNASPSESSNQTPDVIVVGAGISGLSAALDLGRGGAKVTVIDMSSVFGGHAVMSQGSVSIVATPAQERAGIKDSPDLAFQDFHRWGEDPDTDWVRYYVDHSRRDIYDWLDELGVRFSEVLSSSGNSVPREHQPVGRGIGLVTPIYRACLELGHINFVWNSKVEQLLTVNNRVVSVRVRDMRTGDERELRGKAVILATGGFQSNLDMVREFWPAEFRFPDRILAGSGRNSIGIGHQMAQAVGGDLVHMDYQWNYFTGLPDPRYPGTNRGLNATNLYGILVNAEGRRFANFHGWAKEVMPILLKQKDATCWCIFDEAGKPFFSVSGSDWGDFKKVEKLILQNPELVKKADTLEQLAELAGLPVKNVVETVARYNELVEQGDDKDFARFGPGKPAFSNKASPKIAKPPYYAMQTFPLTRKSMGGVAIDLRCRVLDKQKQAIPGLYAVGELTGLAGINGKAALEGTFLGPCIVTGRVAARSLLKELEVPARPAVSNESRCAACHNIPELLSQPREGFWHFEKVHRATADRGLDCRHCHSELTPYRADDHRINRQALTASCVLCHVAQE